MSRLFLLFFLTGCGLFEARYIPGGGRMNFLGLSTTPSTSNYSNCSQELSLDDYSACDGGIHRHTMPCSQEYLSGHKDCNSAYNQCLGGPLCRPLLIKEEELVKKCRNNYLDCISSP